MSILSYLSQQIKEKKLLTTMQLKPKKNVLLHFKVATIQIVIDTIRFFINNI